jgi:alternate signal-mediated exported protein
MRKTTKGALAAGGAAVLLLGGAGTLAYWTDANDVTGGAIKAGTLSITAPSCGSGWTYDSTESAPGAPYTPGTSLLVPGDTITETCTTTLTATGEHMRGTIVASAPASIAPFTVTVGSITDATTALGAGGTFTEANSGDALSITITVTLPGTSDNTTKLASKTLDAITLTATQIHA